MERSKLNDRLIIWVGVVLAAVQLTSGLTMMFHARASMGMLTQGQAESLFARVRPDAGEDSSDHDAQAYVDRLQHEGLLGLAIYTPCGDLIARSAYQTPAMVHANRGRLISRGNGQMVYTMPPGPPHLRDGPCDARHGGPPVLVMLIQTTQANALMWRGWMALVVSVLGALVTLIGAGVIRRLLLRDMALQKQRERDRRLAALGEMSAVMAHELRNPLTSAKGNAQLLLEYREQDEAWKIKKCERIVHELLTIEHRTDHLLRFVRSQTVDCQPVSAQQLTQMLTSLCARFDAVAFDASVQQSLPHTVSIDLQAVEEILENLLANAQDAAQQVVRLRVVVERGELCFDVEDDGPGVAQAEDIFEPFMTTKTHGTGLGLAISQRLALAHDGTLTYQRDRHLTRFSLRIKP